MRKLFVLLVATVLPCSLASAGPIDDGMADDVFGPGFYRGILCDDCRDPYEYPMDFVAVAFNAYFGEDPWLFESNLGWPFRIYTLDGQYVVVWFENFIFNIPTLLPGLFDVYVRFENGRVMSFSILQDGPDLQIGPITEPEPDPELESDSCSCAGGGSDADSENYDEPDEFDPDEPERTGIVEIEDPDEDGEFEPWDREA